MKLNLQNIFSIWVLIGPIFVFTATWDTLLAQNNPFDYQGKPVNQKANGFSGIWYMNGPLDNEYVFKYSGGLGTYCAKHKPFAIYSETANKTFFCYGGSRPDAYQDAILVNSPTGEPHKDRQDLPGYLFHSVSYFDHATGQVARPTIILDKRTLDAHDNPVISMDNEGYLWVFSTAHGTMRPSFMYRSTKAYDIEAFEQIHPKQFQDGQLQEFNNFSYFQVNHIPPIGFVAFYTAYKNGRRMFFSTSKDGKTWSERQMLAHIQQGHYQISTANRHKAATAFNYHPGDKQPGLNWRTNLYYLETPDFGRSWQNVQGQKVSLPLEEVQNACLVHDFQKEGLLVYLKDIRFDASGKPALLFITSKGYKSGPENNPRTWRIAYWNGSSWEIHPITTSDNNYDMGSLFLESDGTWRVIGPNSTGPQAYNPGGEVEMWFSTDKGKNWSKQKTVTSNSPRNHTYVRRPINAHPDFYGFWADGHGRQPSKSKLYFCNKAGDVFVLPEKMDNEMEHPKAVFK